jgi:ribonuclease G
MFREIVINADPNETRVALVEEGELVELIMERPDERRVVGDIYKGRVNAVLPGLQAAFIDIGLDKTAFLHVSDLAGAAGEFDELTDDNEREEKDSRRRSRQDEEARIEQLLQKGQEVLVQIAKEPIGTKGAKVHGRISLPGRYLVLIPDVDTLGVSRRIVDREERHRLKGLLTKIRPAGVGLIVRTAGEGKGEGEFESDVKYLMGQWKKIEKKASAVRAPAAVHRDVELTTGLIRDLFTEDVDRVVVDSKSVCKEIVSYVRTISPDLVPRIKQYSGTLPIFDEYGIESEIEKLLERKVWLKRGGYIIIDHTEALVSIDVNTGRYTGKKDQEETILRTNIEAAKEVARQLRLRDAGGIIVIDFIDMEIEANRRTVLDVLRQALRNDRSRTKAFQVSELGLVEMTRQRVRPSLLHHFTDDCPVCDGVGRILSLDTVLMKIERYLRRIGADRREKFVQFRVNPEVAVHIFEADGNRLARLEKEYRLKLDIKDDPRLKREDIRIISAKSGEDITSRYASEKGLQANVGGSTRTPKTTLDTRVRPPADAPARRGGRRRAAGGRPAETRRPAEKAPDKAPPSPGAPEGAPAAGAAAPRRRRGGRGRRPRRGLTGPGANDNNSGS